MLHWKSSKLIRDIAVEICKSPQRYSENLRNSSETLLWKSIELLRDTALEIIKTTTISKLWKHSANTLFGEQA